MKWAPTFFVLLHSVFLDLKINFLEKPIYLLKLGKKMQCDSSITRT